MPPLPRNARPIRPVIVVWLAVALAVILSAYTFVALRQSRKTLERSAGRSAEALAESLALAIRNVAHSGAVIDELWLARWRDAAIRLYEEPKAAIPRDWLTEFDTPRIDLADLEGRIVRSTSDSPGSTLSPALLADSSFAAIRDGALYAEFDVPDEMQAAIVRHEDRVLVIWNGLERLSNVQRDLGAGFLIRAISELPGLEYVVLQSLDGIEMASRRVEEMSRIAEDTLLLSALRVGRAVSREWTFNDVPVIEAAAPVVDEDRLLRVGVSRHSLELLDRSVTLQLSLLGGLLFVFGVGGLALWSVSQRVTVLQDNLDSAEALTDELFRGLTAGLLVVDEQGNIRLANPPAGQLLGVPHTALVGRRYEDVAPGDPARLVPLLTHGKSSLEEEVEWEDQHGERRILLVSSTRLRSDRPDAVAIVHDITDTRKLARQAEQSERLSALGDLAAGVAHEVRNPLNAISIAAQRLAAEFEPRGDLELYKSLLSHLRSEIDRVNLTVQEFLGLARGLHLSLAPVNVRALAERVADSLKLEAEAKGVRFELDVQGDPTLRGDREALHKALLNLGQNALQATSQGGQVWLRVHPEDRRVRLIVEDTGSGIAAADLPHVFRPYFTRRKGGSGLGLAMVHRIVTDHGGKVDVASEPGVGSTFTVTLPVNSPGEEAAAS